MRSKLLFVLTVGCVLGADAPPDAAAVREVEKAIAVLNDAFKSRDGEALRQLMAADHVAVTPYYGGPLDRDAQVKGLGDHRLTEYTPGKMKIALLGRDSALVTYPLTMKGTYQGRAVPAKSFASAVWFRREGKWLEAFYQETALGSE